MNPDRSFLAFAESTSEPLFVMSATVDSVVAVTESGNVDGPPRPSARTR